MLHDFNGKEHLVNGLDYRLKIKENRISVVLSGTEVAKLSVISAVNRTLADGSDEIPDTAGNEPVLVSVKEEKGKVTFCWEHTGTLWDKKEYILCCDPLRFTYSVSVYGHGAVDSVNYFSGDIQAELCGSYYEFSEGFYPNVSWLGNEPYTFSAGFPYSRINLLMVPPMTCYSFSTCGISQQLAFGLVAEKGHHNFSCFDYKISKNNFDSGFYFSTDQAGHELIDGHLVLPQIVVFSAPDTMSAMEQFAEYYFLSGNAVRKVPSPCPRFWYGPFLCGWIEQLLCAKQQNVTEFSLSTESFYRSMLSSLKAHGLHPKALIIDDKWQNAYADCKADPKKFPDMRRFTDELHQEGISTILWFKLWHGEGLPEELCITNTKYRKECYDPSHPKVKEHLKKVLRRLLSSEEGCYNADGLKLDFAFLFPLGRQVKTASGSYGLELLYELMELIYTEAKKIKPQALINCSPCHPYFAHLCDQVRLHDYNWAQRCNPEEMKMRSRLFSIANPGTLIDTDNAGFTSHRDTMRYLALQPSLGVPDLYNVTGTKEHFAFTEDDWDVLSQVWQEYEAKINGLL